MHPQNCAQCLSQRRHQHAMKQYLEVEWIDVDAMGTNVNTELR